MRRLHGPFIRHHPPGNHQPPPVAAGGPQDRGRSACERADAAGGKGERRSLGQRRMGRCPRGAIHSSSRHAAAQFVGLRGQGPASVTSLDPAPDSSRTAPVAMVPAGEVIGAEWADPALADKLLALHGTEVICLSDPQGRIRSITPAVLGLLGHPPATLHGRLLRDLIDDDDRPRFATLLTRLAPGEAASDSLQMRTAAGGLRSMQVTVRFADPDQPAAGMVSCWRDNQLENELRRQLEQAQRIDPLTGLLSRQVLIDRLESCLAQPGGGAESLAVLSIGIDRLSQVNDALTHRAGDRLIGAIASRLAAIGLPSDQVARGSSDTFLVMLNRWDSVAGLSALAERLRLACKGTVAFESEVLEPSVSIGIAIATAELSAEELLRDASLAMRQASSGGRDRIAFAHRQVSEAPRRALALQSEIRAALEAEAFQAWFMPLVDLSNGEC